MLATVPELVLKMALRRVQLAREKARFIKTGAFSVCRASALIAREQAASSSILANPAVELAA